MICWILLRWCCLVAGSCHCKQYMLSKGVMSASFDGVGDVSSMALTKRSIDLNASSHGCGDDAQQMCLLQTDFGSARKCLASKPKTRLPRDTRLDTDCTLGGNHNNHNTHHHGSLSRQAPSALSRCALIPPGTVRPSESTCKTHQMRSGCLVDLQC
jgi:hypothetical protein